MTIAPCQAVFNWNPHGENAAGNLNTGYEIFYTLDGTEPYPRSNRYEGPVKVENSTLKAVSYNNQIMGAVHSEEFGIAKEGWRLIEASSERSERMAASQAFDAVTRTYWQTEEGAMPHFIAIDLGDNHTLKAMKYTPQTFHGRDDGKRNYTGEQRWKGVDDGGVVRIRQPD